MSINSNRIVKIYFNTLAVEIVLATVDDKFVHSSTLLPSGWDMIETTLKYLESKHNLRTNRLTASNLIKNVGSAIMPNNIQPANAMGRNLITGFPDSITISPEEIYDLLESQIVEIIGKIVMRIETEMLLLKDKETIDKTIVLPEIFVFCVNWTQLSK